MFVNVSPGRTLLPKLKKGEIEQKSFVKSIKSVTNP